MQEYLNRQNSVEAAVEKLRDGVQLIDICYIYSMQIITDLNGKQVETVAAFDRARDDNRSSHKFYAAYSVNEWKANIIDKVNYQRFTLSAKDAKEELLAGKIIENHSEYYFRGNFSSVMGLGGDVIMSIPKRNYRNGNYDKTYIEDTPEKFEFMEGGDYTVYNPDSEVNEVE